MSYPTYPEYTPSYYNWIGDLPKHWKTKKLQWLLKRKTVRNHPDETLLSVYRDYGVIPKSSRDDNFNKPSEDLTNYQLVDIGDLAMNKMKGWQGSLGVSEHRGIVSPAYIICSLNGEMHPRFLHHCLRSAVYIPQYKRLSYGIRPNQWDMHFEDFRELPAIIPSIEEQRTIAAFLDRETARIDVLIGKKERLIKLLEEKRQAVISHAVTKGLNPNAPMKDSGIDWLGQIPEHWTSKRVKHGVSFITSGSRGWADYYSDEGSRFLQSGNIGRHMGLDWSTLQRVSPPSGAEGTRTMVENGDVLVCITGGRTGSVALAQEVDEETYINQHVAMLKPIPAKTSSKFLAYSLWSNVGQKQFALYQYGLKEGLGLDNVLNTFYASPDVEEQNQIVNYLDNYLSRLDLLIDKAKQTIDHLKEHRTSLISASVTGKIDVRLSEKFNEPVK